MDVTVPTAVGDVAHVNLLTFGFPIKGAALRTLPQHFLCV